MSYFNSFREIPYSFFTDAKLGDYKEVTDITFRFKIINYIRSTKLTNMTFYKVEDGDRPDIASYKLYGRPDLHWMLFMYNEMLNPLFEWPMSSVEVYNNAKEKYLGSNLFINVHAVEGFDESSESKVCRNNVSNFPIENYRIGVGDKVILVVDSGGTIKYEGEVLEYDYNLGMLRVNFPSNDFAPDDQRIPISNYHKIEMVTKTNKDQSPITIGVKDYCFAFLKEARLSVHHFEKDGKMISPLEDYSRVVEDKFEEPWKSNLSTASSQKADILAIQNGQSSYLSNICFKDTLLGRYLLKEETNYLVTNDEYELMENEKNREILVPSPNSITDILKDLNRITRR